MSLLSGPLPAVVLAVAALGGAAGLLLGVLARRLPADESPLVARVDALLPQTQCAQCGYPGCLPYARAVVAGAADIDACPPGGAALIRALAAVLDRPVQASGGPLSEAPQPVLAVIDESRCIGCALCLPACPVDAIIGAPRFMHTVLAAECTGCALCLPPCPVDCIELQAA